MGLTIPEPNLYNMNDQHNQLNAPDTESFVEKMKYKGIMERNLGEVWEECSDGYYRCPTRSPLKRMSVYQMQQAVKNGEFEHVFGTYSDMKRTAVQKDEILEDVVGENPPLTQEEFADIFHHIPSPVYEMDPPVEEWRDYSTPANDTFTIASDDKPVFIIYANTRFWRRLWYLVSNPFLYLFKGQIRY